MNQNKLILSVAIATAAITSLGVNAGSFAIQDTKVEQVNVAGLNVQGNGKGTTEKTTYTIDGIEISLTQEEKIKAKYWHLKESEYAQYLFMMKYTPRGLWSPDIDPPIALGNNATTEQERMYYAHLMNQIELDRREAEGAFQLAGIKDIDNRLKAIGWKNSDERRKVQKGEFSKTLPGDKMTLRSLFIDMSECDSDCRDWSIKKIITTSRTVQLDIYVANSDKYTDAELYGLLAIDPGKIVNADINISRSTQMVASYAKGWKTPFMITRDDNGTKRSGLYEQDSN